MRDGRNTVEQSPVPATGRIHSASMNHIPAVISDYAGLMSSDVSVHFGSSSELTITSVKKAAQDRTEHSSSSCFRPPPARGMERVPQRERIQSSGTRKSTVISRSRKRIAFLVLDNIVGLPCTSLYRRGSLMKITFLIPAEQVRNCHPTDSGNSPSAHGRYAGKNSYRHAHIRFLLHASKSLAYPKHVHDGQGSDQAG